MKPLTASSMFLLTVLLAASLQDAQAQRFRLEAAPHIGYGLNVPNQVGDKGSLSIGVQGHLYLRSGRRISLILNPDLDYYLFDVEGVSGFQLDGNVLLGLGAPRTLLMPYVGLGIALTSVSGNDPRTAPSGQAVGSGLTEGTDLGLNLIAGLRFGSGSIHPFFQGRYTLGDQHLYVKDQDNPKPSSGFGVQGGILFKLGR